MTLFEDERVNRLLEALTLFEEICNCKYFDNTPLIVFLNKSDLLKKKIKEVDIAEHFSDYKGKRIEILFFLFCVNFVFLTVFIINFRW